MGRGYLANVTNVPPLIFRFQYGPEVMADKKSFKYNQAQRFGEWGFDQAGAGGSFSLMGLLKDAKEIASLLVATKPVEAVEGELRTIDLEFQLDGLDANGAFDGGQPHGDIRPELAVLRSFMYPSWDVLSDLLPILSTREVPCWNRPPTCALSYGGVSLTCVMTDLNIKLTRFNEQDGTPTRAEVSCTLKEQTYSIGTLTDMIVRLVDVVKSYKSTFLADVTEAAGIPDSLNPFQ